MGSTTGIELGPDSCVLVAVRPRRTGPAEVLALHTIERSEWPSQNSALSEALRAVRRSKKFPRKVRLVAWTLPDGATPGDPVAAAILRPLTAAGFRVDAVLSPPQALASLAATRPRPGAAGAAAWLAVNVHGAAIAIVRGEELLFSRTFEWSYTPGVMGSRAQLLQRYSLVAQLGPEIRRGLAAVRLANCETVDTVITCGDLPELRSLTMPLIEELDLEVETLDSTEGLQAVGKARMERFVESAAAIRLACAAALSATTSNRRRSVGWVRVAAGVALVAALGLGALAYRNGAAPSSTRQQADVRRTAPAAPQGRSNSVVVPSPVRPSAPSSDLKPAPSAAAPSASKPTPTASRPAVTPPASASQPAPSVPSASASKSPQSATLSSPSQSPAPRVSAPSASAPAALPPASASKSAPSPTSPGAPGQPGPTVNQPAGAGRPAPASAGQAPQVVAPPAAKPRGATPGDRVPPSPGDRVVGRREVPLKEPLPRVDSILIDQDRRLAVIDGAVVRVGDRVGSRVVVQIDRDGVALREPSGLAVWIPLRSKSG